MKTSIFAFSIIILTAQSAFAQGIAEYGGLMAMPKPMGAAHSVTGGLNKSFGSVNKSLNSITGSGQSGSGSGTAPSANFGAPVSKQHSAANAQGKVEIIKLAAQSKDLLKQAQTLQKAGKINEAEAAYKKSLGIREAYWKDRDPEIPGILICLAKINIEKQNYEQARKYINASLVVLGKLHGPGSFHRITPCQLQGQIYEAQNDYPRALEAYEQCKILSERLSTEDQSQYLESGQADKIKEKYSELLAKVTGKPQSSGQEPISK